MQGDEKICGIVGALGNILPSGEKAVRQLLVLDTLRGEDSTGLLSVKKYSSDYIVAKQVGNPYELFDTRAYKLAMEGTQRFLLGHNRYATQGKVNKTNAHPFEFDTLIGVHNGTLTNKWKLKDGHKFDVDSQALYNHIEQCGVDDAIRTADGAWALVWWDKGEEAVNIIRNKERPLWFTIVEQPTGNAMFFASEAWMLSVVMSRNGFKFDPPQEFEEGLLYKIPVKNGGNIEKPTIRRIEEKKEEKVIVGNVVVLDKSNTQKKENGETKSNKSVYDIEFVGRKNVTFEALVVKKDQYNAEYIVCYAPSHPYYEGRLYKHQAVDDVFNNIGCEFEGDVASFIQTNSNRVGYYKISPHGAKVTHYPIKKADGSVDDEEETFTDHRGNELTREEWSKKYGSCIFCSSPIFPEEILGDIRPRYTREGEILCVDCANETELAKYVDLI